MMVNLTPRPVGIDCRIPSPDREREKTFPRRVANECPSASRMFTMLKLPGWRWMVSRCRSDHDSYRWSR